MQGGVEVKEKKRSLTDAERNVCNSPCNHCNQEGHLSNGETCPVCGGAGCRDNEVCELAGGLGCES